MSVKFNVDMLDLDKLISKSEKELKNINKEAYDYFREKTPKQSGNAQRNTKLHGNKINPDYGYAKRLDDGWSNQSRDGMSDPTIDRLKYKIIPDAVRRLNRGN